MYRYVYSMIVDLMVKKVHQNCRPATNVKKFKLFPARDSVNDPRGLFDVCRKKKISMCGLGPAVSMLTALQRIGDTRAELVKYATSADVSGDTSAVVGYAGMLFR